MSKYTKGPWKIDDGIHQPEIHAQDGKIRIAIIAVSGFGVSEEHAANAQLISAAPELLEALKAMLVATDCNVHLPEGHPGHVAYLNTVAKPRAKRAIVKAEAR